MTDHPQKLKAADDLNGVPNRGNIQTVPREVHLSREQESRENVKLVYWLKLSRFWTKPLQGTTEDFWFLLDKKSFVKILC